MEWQLFVLLSQRIRIIYSTSAFITPSTKYEPGTIVFCNDVYKEGSVKEGTRTDRGSAGPRTCVDGLEQHMLKGLKWQEFLHHKDNKNDLLHMFCEFLKQPKGRALIPCPVIINDEEHTYHISGHAAEHLLQCNHEEADTRLILHAIMCATDVVVVCKDTDVLILMVWAHHKFNVEQHLYMKYERDKFADIGKICEHLGPEICSNILSIHAISGCDTTSYMHRVGKVRFMRKLLKEPMLSRLLKNLSETTSLEEPDQADIKEFVRSVMYSGNTNETYIETRVRLYTDMKVKTSMSLPPDPSSLLQAIKRVQLQVNIWSHSCELLIPEMDPEEYGWNYNSTLNKMVPVWFVGPQVPPSFDRTPSPMRTAGDDGDDEESEDEAPKRKRRRKKVNDGEEIEIEIEIGDYEADDENEGERICPDDDNEDDEQESSDESSWEVSDFQSDDDSDVEWKP